MGAFNKYKRQFLAIIPMSLISICSGFHLAYGIYNSNLGLKKWMYNFGILPISMVPITFHILAFCGGVYACFLYKRMAIYKLHVTSAALMISGIIVFFLFENYFGTILTARILTGFSFGCSSTSSLFYIPEISSREIRGKLILFQHFCLTIGMFLHAISDSFGIIFGISIFCVVLACLSIPIGYYTMKESHVFLILNGSSESLKRLKFFHENGTEDLDLEHEKTQCWLADEQQRKCNFFGRHNLRTLLIVLTVQISYISVYNALHNYLRIIYMKSFLMEFTETIALSARILGSVTSHLILDLMPKNFQISISGIAISVTLTTFGSLIIFYSYLWMPVIFFMLTEFLLGAGIGGTSEILKSELFPMKEKPISVAVACFVEEGLQIVSLVVLYSWTFGLGSSPTYWPFIFAGILLICSLLVLFNLKDSRKQHVIDACMTYRQ